jgi:hypothetical protein
MDRQYATKAKLKDLHLVPPQATPIRKTGHNHHLSEVANGANDTT